MSFADPVSALPELPQELPAAGLAPVFPAVAKHCGLLADPTRRKTLNTICRREPGFADVCSTVGGHPLRERLRQFAAQH